MNTDRKILDNFITRHPTEAARLLERRTIEDTAEFLKALPADLTLQLFNQFERQTALKCFKMLDTEAAAHLVKNLPRQVVSIYLRQLSEEVRESIFNLVGKETALPLRRTLHYPENCAGALADPAVLIFPEDLNTKEALTQIKKYPEKVIYYLYIVNRNQKLTGVMSIREIMSARTDIRLSNAMHSNVVSLAAGQNFQAILDHPGWQEYHALPVVDETGIFLGVIRYKTLKRIERESKRSILPSQAIATINALGELYQIGLTGLIRSATIPLKESAAEENK